MVTPTLKAAVDRLSEEDRRDLLHYLEQTVADGHTLTAEQVAELECRDADLVGGVVTPLTVHQLMQRVRGHLL